MGLSIRPNLSLSLSAAYEFCLSQIGYTSHGPEGWTPQFKLSSR